MDSRKLTPEQLDRIVYKAALAPSPHNAQGWKFRYDGAAIEVSADKKRRLMRELDPLEKEGAIALGAAVENLVLAAAEEGFSAHVAWLPNGDADSAAASVTFEVLQGSSFANKDELLGGLHAYMERRAMNRSKYTGRPIPLEQMEALRAIAEMEGYELSIVTDQDRIRRFARLAGVAGRFKFSHEPTHRELYHYLRFTAKEASNKRDGLPLEHFNIPSWMARFGKIGMDWRAVRMLNRLGYHRLLAFMQETSLVNSAPAVCMLRSKKGDRIGYLQGGRVFQRLMLAAAKLQLAIQPHSAVADLSYARLSGYDASIPANWRERIDQFPQELREIFSIEDDDLHVVNLFRMGYPTKSWNRRSLRRDMDKWLELTESEEDRNRKDAYYQEFTKRNRPFISSTDQQLLRKRRIAVAGCGSIGGASLEVLARMGAERFLLAEPDCFELNNLNRQNATFNDVGKHKAETILRRIQQINPYVKGDILYHGLTPQNLQYFVGSSSVIIDGVDITEQSALKVKIMLHEEAWKQRKTVISGYDIAGTQLLRVYDYGSGKMQPLQGKFKDADLDRVTPLGFLSKVISPLDLPIEMLPVTRRMIEGTQGSIPQLGPTASLFGVLSAWAALDVLAGRPVRHKIRIDVPDALRPMRASWINQYTRILGIVKLKLYLKKMLKTDKRPYKHSTQGSVEHL